MIIEGIEIGGKAPCRTVCEISNNHNGDLGLAIRLIDAAKKAGAEFVKFQCYTPAELVGLRGDGPAPEPWGSVGWSMSALYKKARTPLAWFPELFGHARSIGVVPFASVFGPESMDVLEAVNCPAYKISKFEGDNLRLMQTAVSRGKTVFVSRLIPKKAPYRVANLYCPGGYPCDPKDIALPNFGFGDLSFLGLSSHCTDTRLPIAAVAKGAKLVEMHFQLKAEPSELESNVSINETQWKKMVSDIRATEAML